MDQKHARMDQTDVVRVATFEFHTNVQTSKLKLVVQATQENISASRSSTKGHNVRILSAAICS